jgi:uncharacterized protein GlcG (DUF336 family)
MLNFETAQALANAVLAEGLRRNSSPLTVAVLDSGGHQIVLYRQDGAGFLRPQIALGKAWGALGLGFSSRGIANVAARVPAFFDALAVAAEGRMFPAAGGVLLRTRDSGIIGAVGVSGDNSDVDEACAIVAAHEVGLEPEPLQPSA